MKTTQNALANIIISCLLMMTFLAALTFFRTSNDPTSFSKVIEALGGIVLVAAGGKLGLATPSSVDNISIAPKGDGSKDDQNT